MRRLLAAALALGLVGLATPAAASDPQLPAVKAAFVFNFIKLVNWPESRVPDAAAPLRVCVLRSDAMEEPLRQILGTKSVGLHPLEVASMSQDEDFAPCHVLYLGPQAASRYPALMARTSGKGVLLIDEGPQFTWPDGMIRLFLEQNRVRFELNLEALERAGLAVDPRLVRLARVAPR